VSLTVEKFLCHLCWNPNCCADDNWMTSPMSFAKTMSFIVSQQRKAWWVSWWCKSSKHWLKKNQAIVVVLFIQCVMYMPASPLHAIRSHTRTVVIRFRGTHTHARTHTHTDKAKDFDERHRWLAWRHLTDWFIQLVDECVSICLFSFDTDYIPYLPQSSGTVCCQQAPQQHWWYNNN